MPIKLNIRQGTQNFLNKPLPNFLQKPVSSLNTGLQNFSQTGVGRVVTAPLRIAGTGGGRIGSGLNYYAGNKKAIKSDFIEPIKATLGGPAGMFKGLGEAIAQPFVGKQEEAISNQAIDQADLYTKKAIEFSKAGDKQKADQYFQLSRDILDKQRGRTNERLGELETSKQELIKSGTDTAKLAMMAYNPASALRGGIFGAALGSALSDEPQAMAEGFNRGLTTGAVTGTTKTVIAGLLDKFGTLAPLANNKFAGEFIGRNLAGGFNILEDRLIDKLNNEDPSWQKDLFSYLIGVVLGGGSKKGDWEKLKNEMRIGLDDKDMETIRRTFNDISKNVTWTVKYKQGMGGQLEPVISLENQDTLGNIRLLTRDEAIKNNLNVLPEGEEKTLVKQFTQGGFAKLGSEPEVSKQDLDLVNEARKYKSAEEFVKAQPRMRDRTFLKRLEESPEISSDLKTKLETLPQQYEQESRTQAEQIAQKLVKEDLEGAIKKFDSPNILGQERIVTGYALLDELQKAGRNNEARRIADEITSDLTEAGRTVEAARVLTRLDGPTFQLQIQKIFDEMNKRKLVFGEKPKMTDELIAKITKTMDLVKATNDEDEKLRLVKKLLNEDIAPEIPPSFSELLDSFRHNNMLSSPKSWSKNIYGNLFQALISKPITMALQAPLDFGASLLFGKERQYYLKDVPKYYKNLFNATPNAMSAFAHTMKDPTFLDMENGFLSTASLKRYLQAKRVPGALTIGSRPMEALDKMISVPMAASEKARLIDLGMDEKEAEKKAKELAERWLFRAPLDPNNKSNQGFILSWIDKGAVTTRTITQKFKPLSWLAPYINTPTQLVKQLIEFSPGGFATIPGASAERATEQLAKSIAGSLAMYFGFQAVIDGQTTWAVPTSEEARTLFYDAGMKPYSIKIGDKWIPFSYLGVFGLALAIPAAHKYYNEQNPKSLTDTEFEKIQKMLADSAGYLASQTSMPNLLESMQIVMGQSKRKWSDVVGFASTQIIPFSGMLRYISQIFDPIYRQSESIRENMLKATPFKTKLDPYLTSEGEPSTRTIWDFLPYGIGVDKPEFSQRLNELQKIQQIKEVPAWYKRELNKIQESIRDIYRNVEMTDEEREQRLEKEFEKIDKLQERYETIIPKMQNVIQQPRMQEPTSPSREPQPPPARLEPTTQPKPRMGSGLVI